MRFQRSRAVTASIASSVLILSLGLTPTINAADHLDGPGVANNGAADITDFYEFSTANGQKTVFVLDVNPGAGVLAQSGTTFGPASVQDQDRYERRLQARHDVHGALRLAQRHGRPEPQAVSQRQPRFERLDRVRTTPFQVVAR